MKAEPESPEEIKYKMHKEKKKTNKKQKFTIARSGFWVFDTSTESTFWRERGEDWMRSETILIAHHRKSCPFWCGRRHRIELGLAPSSDDSFFTNDVVEWAARLPNANWFNELVENYSSSQHNYRNVSIKSIVICSPFRMRVKFSRSRLNVISIFKQRFNVVFAKEKRRFFWLSSTARWFSFVVNAMCCCDHKFMADETATADESALRLSIVDVSG